MRSIVPLSLAACFFGAGVAIAQAPTGVGLLEEGVVGHHPELVAVPREGLAASAPPAVAEAPRARATPSSAIPLDSLRATRERPLFSETRRPPVVANAEPIRAIEPPPEPEPEEPEAPGLTLIGTVVGAEETVAVFLNSMERQVVRLRVGEAESGWTLRSVARKTTTLEKASREVTLSLPAPDAQSASGGNAPAAIDAFMQPPVLGGVPGNAASRGRPPVPFQSGLPGRPIPQRGGQEF